MPIPAFSTEHFQYEIIKGHRKYLHKDANVMGKLAAAIPIKWLQMLFFLLTNVFLDFSCTHRRMYVYGRYRRLCFPSIISNVTTNKNELIWKTVRVKFFDPFLSSSILSIRAFQVHRVRYWKVLKLEGRVWGTRGMLPQKVFKTEELTKAISCDFARHFQQTNTKENEIISC